MYATTHHIYDLLDLYDMQNDANSRTTLGIGQNSKLVWSVTQTFWQIC